VLSLEPGPAGRSTPPRRHPKALAAPPVPRILPQPTRASRACEPRDVTFDCVNASHQRAGAPGRRQQFRRGAAAALANQRAGAVGARSFPGPPSRSDNLPAGRRMLRTHANCVYAVDSSLRVEDPAELARRAARRYRRCCRMWALCTRMRAAGGSPRSFARRRVPLEGCATPAGTGSALPAATTPRRARPAELSHAGSILPAATTSLACATRAVRATDGSRPVHRRHQRTFARRRVRLAAFV
jgi:hypothetical protein